MSDSTLKNAKRTRLDRIGAPRFVPERSNQPELLDQGEGTSADVETNLTEMWRINRAFGGLSSLTTHLFPLLERATEPIRIVDVGTGSAEIAMYIAHWAQHKNLEVKVYALDISGRNLTVARKNIVTGVSKINLIQADVTALPFPAESIDYYISSLFLHHFAPQRVIELLSMMYHRARRGIIMSDLVRGHLPLMAFRLIEPLYARNYLTCHDGRLSINRAYTPSELHTLAQSADIHHPSVFNHFPWRMTLVAEKRDV